MSRRAPLYALYVADTISLAGNAVAQLAIPWFVLTTTGSATYTALAVFFLRKIPFPFTLANIIVGASTVRYRDFVVGTLLGVQLIMSGISAIATGAAVRRILSPRGEPPRSRPATA